MEPAPTGRSPATVIKVGGSLLTEAASLQALVEAIAGRRRQGERIVVVVSAFAGVTDLLVRELWRVRAGERPFGGGDDGLAEALWRRHAGALSGSGEEVEGAAAARRLAAEVAALLAGARRAGAVTRHAQARILSYGERISAPLVAAAIRHAGVEAGSATAEEIGLRAHGPVRDGVCDLENSRTGAAALAGELARRVVVVTGFYGSDAAGGVVLFGRGGSDYTAGVLAALLGADRLEFWKDVPGYFTANPRRVPAARLVPELSFAEAAALAMHGARILHPRSLEPLWELPVKVRVGPPGCQETGGTALVRHPSAGHDPVRALAVRAPRTVVRVAGSASSAELRSVGGSLERLGEDGFPLDAVSVSRHSFCFAVADDRPYDVSETLRALGGPGSSHVSVRHFPAWIGVVGHALAGDPESVGRVNESLALATGEAGRRGEIAGDAVIRCRLGRGELMPALQTLHRRFFA